MNGYALFYGKRKPKVVEIATKAEPLWWLAWDLDCRSLVNAPIKIGNLHQKELREAGYDVRRIRFERVIEDTK